MAIAITSWTAIPGKQALKDLSKDKIDSNDNTVYMTVHTYDIQFWNIHCHLHIADVDHYDHDLCPPYPSGLNAKVKKYVERKYPNFHCVVMPPVMFSVRPSR
jgi:hypothetical protein